MATPKSAGKKGRKSQTPKVSKAQSAKKKGAESAQKKEEDKKEEEKVVAEEEEEMKVEEDDGKEDEMKDDAANEESEEKDGDGKKKRQRKRKRKGDNKSEGGDEEEEEGDDDDEDEESKKSPNKKNKSETVHTVYVDGLPYTSSETELKKFFKEHGDITDIVDVRLSRWRDTGRLRGFGHVQFGSLESHKKALTLQGKKLGARYLNIQNAEAPRKDGGAAGGASAPPREQPPGCRTVYVRNLPYSTSAGEIRSVFSRCGRVADSGVRMVYAANGKERRFKGFAYVEFKNPEGAYEAVQKGATPDGISVGGRRCQLDYDDSGKAKESYRTQDGKLYNKEQRSKVGAKQ